MVLDTSAVVAILTREPGYEKYLDALDKDPDRLMSAATLYEAAVVLFRECDDFTLVEDLKEFLAIVGVAIVPFDAECAWDALGVYARFGKGLHPARLNLLDSVAYQAASRFGEPLLFKGSDFARTDITPAV